MKRFQVPTSRVTFCTLLISCDNAVNVSRCSRGDKVSSAFCSKPRNFHIEKLLDISLCFSPITIRVQNSRSWNKTYVYCEVVSIFLNVKMRTPKSFVSYKNSTFSDLSTSRVNWNFLSLKDFEKIRRKQNCSQYAWFSGPGISHWTFSSIIKNHRVCERDDDWKKIWRPEKG